MVFDLLIVLFSFCFGDEERRVKLVDERMLKCGVSGMVGWMDGWMDGRAVWRFS